MNVWMVVLMIVSSTMTGVAAAASQFPEEWRVWCVLAGVVGTAISGTLIRLPRREWTPEEREAFRQQQLQGKDKDR